MQAVQVLHLGCVSSVFLAADSSPGAREDNKVVKAYHKATLQSRHLLNITREVANLRQLKELGVPGVVDLCGTADDATNLYLVFEPCLGGDLYKRLSHTGLLGEEQLCREVVVPLLRVLVQLHQLGIAHRDIKPENIFFDADGRLKLGDFGLAINAARERAVSRVGTLAYMAPEVLAQPSADMVAQRCMRVNLLPAYDSKVDIWACGVLVHEALTGLTPFHDADPQTAALKAQFRPPRQLGGATPACADFVAQALTKQAAKRPTALQLLAHPWVLTHAGVQHVLAASPLCMPTAPIRITKAACTPQMELISCSAPLAASSYMPAAAPSKQPQPAAQPEPKQLPQQTRPQQLPPHPFAASQGMLLECRALSGPVQLEAVDIAAADDATGFAAVAAQGPLELLTSPLPACKQRGGAARPGFVRQLSSPVLVKSSRQPQEPVLLPAPSDPPSSPPPSRVSMLAASPVRALLLGAGRHLMRQRSGGNAPSDGVPGTRTTSVRRSSFSLMRSPLPRAAAGSPIRGLSLLQGRRRVPPPAPASASLFAAAQWKPAAGQGSLASAASVCSSSGGPPAALSKASSSDCSPSIMSAFGGHSSCGSISSSIAADRTGSQPLTVTASRSSSGAVADAAAVEAPHGHQQCAGAASPHSASGGSQHLGSGRSRALFLSRTPSAPDPGPLLVAGSPPVRHGSGAARAAPSGGGDAVADQRPPSGLQSMRCVWLKVQGICRSALRQPGDGDDDLAAHLDRVAARGP